VVVELPSPLPVELPSPELVADGLAVTAGCSAPVPRSTTTSGVLVLEGAAWRVAEPEEALSLTVALADSATPVAVSLTAAVAFCTAGMPAISRNLASIWV
jgi:hypothetical protein